MAGQADKPPREAEMLRPRDGIQGVLNLRYVAILSPLRTGIMARISDA
jgi:hypothetical protein